MGDGFPKSLADLETLDLSGYKEDAVRESVVLPLLHCLGYKHGPGSARIAPTSGLPVDCDAKAGRRYSELDPGYVMVGSSKQPIHTFPDFVVEVDGAPAFVVETKRPSETVGAGTRMQALFYAIHPDIRALYVVLTNGDEIRVFSATAHERDATPVLAFRREDIRGGWPRLQELLSPPAIRRHRVVVGANLAHDAVPPMADADVWIGRTNDAMPVVQLRTKAGQQLHGTFTLNLGADDPRLEELLAGRAEHMEFAGDEVGDLVVGDDRVNLTAHFDDVPEHRKMRLTRIPPTPQELYIVAVPSFVGVRITSPVVPHEGGWVIGTDELGVKLLLGGGRPGSLSLDPRGLSVPFALRIVEFMAALARDQEFMLLDVDGVVRLHAPFHSAAVPSPLLVQALKAAAYVSLVSATPIHLPNSYTNEELMTAEAARRLFCGIQIPAVLRASGVPGLCPGARFGVPSWELNVLGAPVDVGAVIVDVVREHPGSGDAFDCLLQRSEGRRPGRPASPEVEVDERRSGG